jgi:hypothetical protein
VAYPGSGFVSGPSYNMLVSEEATGGGGGQEAKEVLRTNARFKAHSNTSVTLIQGGTAGDVGSEV